jgi:hypothetical protein
MHLIIIAAPLWPWPTGKLAIQNSENTKILVLKGTINNRRAFLSLAFLFTAHLPAFAEKINKFTF